MGLGLGLELPHLLAEARLGNPTNKLRHSTIWRNLVNKVLFICCKCLPIKTDKYLLVITSANIFSKFNYSLIVLNEKYVY